MEIVLRTSRVDRPVAAVIATARVGFSPYVTTDSIDHRLWQQQLFPWLRLDSTASRTAEGTYYVQDLYVGADRTHTESQIFNLRASDLVSFKGVPIAHSQIQLA